jgi:hypothetical protein
MSTPTSEVQDLEKATTSAATTTSATSIASQPSNDTLNSSNTSSKSSRFFSKRQGSVLSLESQRLKFSEVSASDVLSRSLQMLFAFMGMMGIIIFFSQWSTFTQYLNFVIMNYYQIFILLYRVFVSRSVSQVLYRRGCAVHDFRWISSPILFRSRY